MRLIHRRLLFFFLFTLLYTNALSNHKSNNKNRTINLGGRVNQHPTVVVVQPFQLDVHDVSLTYPLTLKRRLFSSVPYREWAIDDVSFRLDAGSFCLLTGASSCGKSCLLKLMAGSEIPSKGTVEWTNTNDDKSMPNCHPHPVYLDQRKQNLPPDQSILDVLLRCKQTRPLLESISTNGQTRLASVEHVVETIMGWDENETIDKKKVQDLTTSEVYLLQIVQSCLISMLSSTDVPPPSTHPDEDAPIAIANPILFLDEWLDLESTVVIRNVQLGLERVCDDLGGIVCSVTHCPERYHPSSQAKEMRSGKLLTTTS